MGIDSHAESAILIILFLIYTPISAITLVDIFLYDQYYDFFITKSHIMIQTGIQILYTECILQAAYL